MVSEKSVLVVGAGAVGALFGWRFQKAGAKVSVVCRSNYQTVKTKGFQIRSLMFGNGDFTPDFVLASGESPEPGYDAFDFIFVSTKSLPNIQNPAEAIAPYVTSSKPVIVLLQNGVGIEDPFAQLFPNNAIVTCVVRVNATQVEAGVIEHGTLCRLIYGLHAPQGQLDPTNDILSQLDSFLRLGEVESVISPNIQKDRWLKVAWNAAFGPISILSGGNDARSLVENPLTNKLMRDAMHEVFMAGHAVLDEPLVEGSAEDAIEAYISFILLRPNAVYPSILFDCRGKRPMEHQILLKNPLDLAKKAGVSTPVLDTLYALLVSTEKKYL